MITRSHGQAWQGCREMEAGPAVASLRQDLGDSMGLKLGPGQSGKGISERQ